MASLALLSPYCCCAHATSKAVNNYHNGVKKELRFCYFDSSCSDGNASNLCLGARVLSSALEQSNRFSSPARGWGVARRRWRLCANAEARVAVDGNVSSSRSYNVVRSQPPITPSVEIPVTCYQILGVSDQAEKDEIVKSAMQLKNAHIEDGYTSDVMVNRQNLLMDARDKLLFEPEYSGDIKEKIQPKSSLRIPWTWFPAALCLLQEAGEDKVVLDIGRKALQHPDAKAYIHDVLLSMALAECAIAKAGFEKNNISKGFEALARAQCLLRSKTSLGKTTLLSQIEESLEEIAPACTLELLGLPNTPENAERRIGAISALCELLRQGLDVESSCRVQEWPCFLNQALSKLMAREIVELLSWDDLALTRKNKKSLESHNQRGVIDFNCFYMVLIAHVAHGFATTQKDVILKAQKICDCLISSEGIDLKFEEAFCLFLLGQGDEATASEKLRQLEKNSKPAAPRSSTLEKEVNHTSSARKSLELWLKDSVLGVFPDTRDCSPSLANFFAGEKRISGNRQAKRPPQAISLISHKPVSPPLALDRKSFEDKICIDSTRHLGSAVKQLTPPNLQFPLAEGKVDGDGNANSPIRLKGNLGSRQNKVWEIWFGTNIIGKMTFVTAFGFVVYACFRLINMQFYKMGNAPRWRLKNPTASSSISGSNNSSRYQDVSPASISDGMVAEKLKKLLSMLKIQRRQQTKRNVSEDALLGASSFVAGVCKQPMPEEEAETLVKKWQDIKAEALGPHHHVHRLFDILDESMLDQWQDLADAAKANSCFWKFVLLQLSILRADIFTDESGEVVAEIEAILEEAAELVDNSQPKNPNYYSTYEINYHLKRRDDGSWRFCKCDIRAPS
ncbi:OLC1v1013926C1 [Oldenlandia corymbosa var. corymbosa]|uniref:OLC1v1013926C1 n=1 Tax=Oldenlandia corymbosa var. corymbosa TaxID=529605 RepID=A0AAV1E1K7_OLDCO|nr:OLC1v1013926C1 [Oldenlandia corymbosa var. corymbosa]